MSDRDVKSRIDASRNGVENEAARRPLKLECPPDAESCTLSQTNAENDVHNNSWT